jgi:alpha-N-arabinofuranosidase
MDSFIDEVVAIADSVSARRRSTKRIMLSFDEWNVWYRTRRPRANRIKPGWPVAPEILEEIYDMADALAFGGACISLLNHADRVKAACLAQLVNVIAPIMTETGGPAWRQTIFHPFAQMSRYGRGDVLRTRIESDIYDASYYDPRGDQDIYYPVKAPYLKLSAVAGEGGKSLTLFALNRDLKGEMQVQVDMRGFDDLKVAVAEELRHDKLDAVNDKNAPDRVSPQRLDGISVADGAITMTLKPASWNVIRLESSK